MKNKQLFDEYGLYQANNNKIAKEVDIINKSWERIMKSGVSTIMLNLMLKYLFCTMDMGLMMKGLSEQINEKVKNAKKVSAKGKKNNAAPHKGCTGQKGCRKKKT